MATSKSIFTLQFWLLCASSFMFTSSFSMLLPELPDYLSNMGGGEFKGLIIGLFTLTAGISRPFSGKLTDKIGRVPVMVFGSMVCVVCGFLYPICTTLIPFFILRAIHGFSTGFKPTGSSAYIADIVPIDKRGESMGIHGLINGLGMAFGPSIGSWLVMNSNINYLFYTSSALSLMSVLILGNIKETLKPELKQKFSLGLLKINRTEIFDSSVWPVVIVIFFTSFSYGTIVTLIPDMSKHLGIANKGYFFLIYTLASIGFRFLSGRWSDKSGRIPLLIIGCILLMFNMFFIAFTTNFWMFTVSAILFGVCMGIISPVASAWTIDLCEDENRGKAIASMFIALEAGIGCGALIPTWFYKNDINNLSTAFLCSNAFVVIALFYLLINRKKLILTLANKFIPKVDLSTK